jgi:hypothetical protein
LIHLSDERRTIETMSTETFINLVNQVVDAARSGEILGQDLYLSALECATPSWCRSEPKTVAQTIRQLGDFCDWEAYRWATERVDAGVDYDDLPAEIKRIKAEQETIPGGVAAQETLETLRL